MNSDRIPKKMFYSIIRNFSDTFVEILVENCQVFVRSIFHEYLTRSFKLLSITLEVFVFCRQNTNTLKLLLIVFVSYRYYSLATTIRIVTEF
jgi:hypothetical protein